jgi:steroid 5-alpha reductase family enzyme
MCALAAAGWLLSLHKRDVSVVDPIWPLFFLTGTVVYGIAGHFEGTRAVLIYLCVGIWALRLSLHLIVRSWGEPEDRRYTAIRQRNEPGFEFKSLYLVFVLQAVLAAIIGVPLLSASSAPTPLNGLDRVAFGVWLCGFAVEAIADLQLVRFKRDPASRGRVLDRGLWSWSRHPNYFGEALLWWGFYLFALAAGASWTVFSPILMTFLLLKVSGVTLLEHDIRERRPAYAEYVSRTSAFIPWPPGKSGRTRARTLSVSGVALLLLPLLSLMGCRNGSKLPPLPAVSQADYRIIYLTPDYHQTVIARAARDYVWLMARSPELDPSDYERMLAVVRKAGYDVNKLQRVPQRWPGTAQP